MRSSLYDLFLFYFFSSSSPKQHAATRLTSTQSYSANMERIIRAQAFSDPKKAQFLMAQKVLELNPRHPIVIELNNRVEEAAAAKAKEEEEKGESEEDAEAAEDDGDAVGSKKDDASRYHKGALDIDKGTRDLAFLLYDLSLLNSGFPVFDQKLFAKRLLHMTARGLSLDTVKLVDEIEVPEDEEGEGEEEEEVEVEADGETSQ